MFSLFPMSEDERVETAGIVAAQEHRLQVGAAVRCTLLIKLTGISGNGKHYYKSKMSENS
jgi:hypothetical protein